MREFRRQHSATDIDPMWTKWDLLTQGLLGRELSHFSDLMSEDGLNFGDVI